MRCALSTLRGTGLVIVIVIVIVACVAHRHISTLSSKVGAPGSAMVSLLLANMCL